MTKWVKWLAIALACVAVLVLAYALLTPQTAPSETDHMGMGGMSYGASGVALVALSLVMLVVAIMILLLWQEYEPLPPTYAQMPLAIENATKTPAVVEPAAPAPAPPHDREEVAAREYLILRLLTGDERTMFKAVADSGGEALQKDLIVRTRMSNAKVSRLLDKLEQKGVITKERHGATNRIRIKPE